VTIEYAARASERPLESDVAAAVRKLVSDGLDADVLVFLPGAAEIRKAQAACAPVAAQAQLDVVMLHGDLPPAEQDRAVAPGTPRKIILSTNVAETSITVEGVVAVIDSGLARVAALSPWSGVSTLKVQRISRASATQRRRRSNHALNPNTIASERIGRRNALSLSLSIDPPTRSESLLLSTAC